MADGMSHLERLRSTSYCIGMLERLLQGESLTALSKEAGCTMTLLRSALKDTLKQASRYSSHYSAADVHYLSLPLLRAHRHWIIDSLQQLRADGGADGAGIPSRRFTSRRQIR